MGTDEHNANIIKNGVGATNFHHEYRRQEEKRQQIQAAKKEEYVVVFSFFISYVLWYLIN